MDALTVRVATAADRDALLALTPRLADVPRPPWCSAGEIAAADNGILLAALDGPGPDAVVLVAGEPGAAAHGVVFVSTKADYFTAERHAHVGVLAVAAEAQGRGVARARMAAAEAWTAARGDRCITINVFDANRRARGLYARLGYLPETIHYRKNLAPDRGETDAFSPDLTRKAALAARHPAGGRTFVAVREGQLLGTYLLKANQPGLGSHVANCGYMVSPAARGQGLGEALCRNSLEAARELGFQAMQFNSVVSTNSGAIALWQRCDFSIVGTVPLAFRHPRHGLVDIHVMHRLL